MNTGPLIVQDREGRTVRFIPTSGLHPVRTKEYNSGFNTSLKLWREGKLGSNLSARFLIGMNVGRVKVWTEEDISCMFVRLRTRQHRSVGLTLLAGSGVFEGDKGMVREDSVQLFALDFDADNAASIREAGNLFIDIAYNMALRLLQESIILELSKHGQVLFSDLVETGFAAQDLRTPAQRDKDNAAYVEPSLQKTRFFLKSDIPNADMPSGWWGPDELEPKQWPFMIEPAEVVRLVASQKQETKDDPNCA
jgi:hypothetical protein